MSFGDCSNGNFGLHSFHNFFDMLIWGQHIWSQPRWKNFFISFKKIRVRTALKICIALHIFALLFSNYRSLSLFNAANPLAGLDVSPWIIFRASLTRQKYVPLMIFLVAHFLKLNGSVHPSPYWTPNGEGKISFNDGIKFELCANHSWFWTICQCQLIK